MVTFVLQRTFCVLLLQIFGFVPILYTFQCKEDTFRYFWVSKLLEIFFLFDLFWVPIPGLTVYPRACIVLHVSLIGGHRQIGACFPQPVWSSRSSWYIGIAFVKTLHFTTLVIFTLILESFSDHNQWIPNPKSELYNCHLWQILRLNNSNWLPNPITLYLDIYLQMYKSKDKRGQFGRATGKDKC